MIEERGEEEEEEAEEEVLVEDQELKMPLRIWI
jgi:hypothetical protein